MAQLVMTATLLPKLASLLTAEYSLHKAARGEIMFLKVEMESMQAALVKISQAPIDDPPDAKLTLWAKEVRDLSHDLEDSVDKFMVRVRLDKSHTFMGFIDRSINLLTKAKIRHKIVTDMRDIKSRVKEVSKRRDAYKVDIVPARPTVTTPDSLGQLASCKKATELIGTEEKSNELVKMLIEGDEVSVKQLKMVSIVGFGGLGKTTLANLAYQKLKPDFDCGAFVSVSFTPNIASIFKNLLHQLDKNCYHNIHESSWGEAKLVSEIREYLQNKRYIIVIDDIWDKSVWKNIKCALIENACGSRVITTTRILDVAKEDGVVYEMKPLSIADSKILFYRRIFGKEEECTRKQLVKVSENILMKCGGIPLAIMTISSLLAARNDCAHWFKVYQSMGIGLENNPDVNDMRRILYVSYYDLPAHLKICLLYLSLYPDNYTFKRKDLIWKWVGEGFIQPKQGESLYELGEEYFNELINKSLIQPVSSTLNLHSVFLAGSKKKASYCRVHDMVVDLITCLSHEENFMTTLGGHEYESVPGKIRRLSLYTNKQEDANVLSTMNLSHVRSLTVFKKSFSMLPSLSSFPLLSALDLTNCKHVDDRHSMIICNMFHLRYLRLYGTYITMIPREIENLQLLQVLDIGETEIEELPSTFEQLRQLVYLRVNNWIRVPYGSENMKSLQELKSVMVMSPSVLHDLSGLTELRCLDMKVVEWDKSFEKPFRRCLSNLINLQTLKVSGCDISEDSECESLLPPGPQQLHRIIAKDCMAYSVPRWMSSLSSLSYLVISLYTLSEEDLHALGCLPSLRHLNMDVCRHTPRKRQAWPVIDVTGYPFKCLTELRYVQHAEVVFAPRAMPKLQVLELHLGVKDTMHQSGYFDLGLENLSSLQQVTIGLDSYKAGMEEVEAAEAAIRQALGLNPNKPTLNLI